MNREKAIEILKDLLDCNYVDSFDDEENEALKFAIDTLEQKTDDLQTFEILKEIKNDCKNRRGCKGCKFFPCKICDLPAYWDV